MTKTEMLQMMLSRIDPAYKDSTAYQTMAETAFTEALRKFIAEADDSLLHGFRYKVGITNVSEYSFASIKTTEQKEFVRMIGIFESDKTKSLVYFYKDEKEFSDPYNKPISSKENYYTVRDKKILFYTAIGSTQTANLMYFGIPTIGTSDDMGQYLGSYALEAVIAGAMQNLINAIRGAE